MKNVILLIALAAALPLSFPAIAANDADKKQSVKFGKSDRSMKSLVNDGFMIVGFNSQYFISSSGKTSSKEFRYMLQKQTDVYSCSLVNVFNLSRSGVQTFDRQSSYCNQLVE